MEKEKFMYIALEEAKKAYELNEVPIGAVLVCNNQIIAKGFNKKEKNNSALEHAEIDCIRQANKILNNWRLSDCELYVTLFPCMMCAGAIIQSRIKNVYYGAPMSDKNEQKHIEESFNIDLSNPEVTITGGILENECSMLLKEFFSNKRNGK